MNLYRWFRRLARPTASSVSNVRRLSIRRFDSAPVEVRSALLAELKEVGDKQAIGKMAHFYDTAVIVRADGNHSVEWHLAVAEGGDPHALWRTARALFRIGKFEQALDLTRRSAAQGYVAAEVLMAYAMECGLGIDRDVQSACSIYRQFSNEDPVALMAYARCLRDGIGCDVDTSQFQRLIELGMERNIADAWYSMGALVESEKGTELSGRRRALLFYQRAAELGSLNARSKCGMFYAFGYGGEINVERALDYLSDAATFDDAGAKRVLAQLLYGSEHIQRDDENLLHLCFQAAFHGDTIAESLMGLIYESGRLVRQNVARARKWYGRAGEKGATFSSKRLRSWSGVLDSQT